MASIPLGTRVLLAGGESGRVIRIISGSAEPSYIVELDRRRSNGTGVDVVLEIEMEVVKEGARI